MTGWFNAASGIDNGRIGCLNQNSGGNTNFLAGDIDGVGIWNTNKTVPQILSIATNEKAYGDLTAAEATGLVAWYDLNETDGASRADSSGNGYTATDSGDVGVVIDGKGTDTTVSAGDLTTSLVSFYNMEERSGNRADSHGSNTLTDNNTVGVALGHVVETPVVDVSKIWRWVDQSDNAEIFDQDTAVSQPNYDAIPPNCLTFDGSADFFDITSVLTGYLASTTQGTWAMWVRPTDATPAANEEFIAFGDTNADEYLSARIDTAGRLSIEARTAGANTWRLRTTGAVFADATWAHIAVVQDGVSPVIYVNGSQPAQAFAVSVDITDWFNDFAGLDNGRVGCLNTNSAGNANHFDGQIDDLVLSDEGLSAGVIKAIWQAGKSTHE